MAVLTTSSRAGLSHRLFLADNDEAVCFMMSMTLERNGADVVAAANVTEFCKLSSLRLRRVYHGPAHAEPLDRLALITATPQPRALTLLVRDYLDGADGVATSTPSLPKPILRPFLAQLYLAVHNCYGCRCSQFLTPILEGNVSNCGQTVEYVSGIIHELLNSQEHNSRVVRNFSLTLRRTYVAFKEF